MLATTGVDLESA